MSLLVNECFLTDKMRFLLICTLFLFACNGKLAVAEKPVDLLTEQQMEDVLGDLMILEGHINATYETVNRYHKIMTKSGEDLLKTKHITVKQYETSFVYYNANPEQMERILDNVMDKLQKESIILQQELKDTLAKQQSLINDSLKLPPTLKP